jgi:hypothetical protein
MSKMSKIERSDWGLGNAPGLSQQPATGPWDMVENSAVEYAEIAEQHMASGNEADAIEAIEFAYLAASRTPIGEVLAWYERTK